MRRNRVGAKADDHRFYGRAKLIARELGMEHARTCSAFSPRAMDGLSADHWLIERGVPLHVVDLVECHARKRDGATVEFVSLGRGESGE